MVDDRTERVVVQKVRAADRTAGLSVAAELMVAVVAGRMFAVGIEIAAMLGTVAPQESD